MKCVICGHFYSIKGDDCILSPLLISIHVLLIIALTFAIFRCLSNWRKKNDEIHKANVAAELNNLENQLRKDTSSLGLDDSIISFDGPDGKKKVRAKRVIGGIDYLNDVDDLGNVVFGKNEVKIK